MDEKSATDQAQLSEGRGFQNDAGRSSLKDGGRSFQKDASRSFLKDAARRRTQLSEGRSSTKTLGQMMRADDAGR